MEHYATTHETPNRRIRWVQDDHYQSEGSFAYETEEETAKAVREEREALVDGRYVALGAIVETRCPTCEGWVLRDSLWGIVIEPDIAKLVEFAEHSLVIPADVTPADCCPEPAGLSADSLIVRKVLSISTAHIPETQARRIVGSGPTYEPDFGGLRKVDTGFGWIVWDLADSVSDACRPDWLRPIIERCRDLGCSMVEFDRDAETDDRLPSFDW